MKYSQYSVKVNGVIEKNAAFTFGNELTVNNKHTKVFSIRFTDENIIKLLTNSAFSEVEKFLGGLSFVRKIKSFPEIFFEISIHCMRNGIVYSDRKRSTTIFLKPTDRDKWKKPYSIEEMINSVFAILDQRKDSTLGLIKTKNSTLGTSMWHVKFFHEDADSIIGNHLEEVINLLTLAVEHTDKNLSSEYGAHTISAVFNFPEEIKTACKQYLLYFAEFLADLGIKARTEIKDEIHQTLFNVVPIDKTESLNKIRDALDVYLNAPSANNFDVELFNAHDIAVNQWVANVHHLRSQMLMANSVIQMKDATIQMLELTNYELKKKLETNEKKSDEEDVIPGIMSLKKYDGKWFAINLPEIFRRLKRKPKI